MGNPKRKHSWRRGRGIHVNGSQGENSDLLEDANTRRGIERMEMEHKVESAHHSLVIMVKRGRKERMKKEKRRDEQEVASVCRG